MMTRRPKILVVDDDSLILLNLIEALDDVGYSIIETGTAEDAMAQLEVADFAAVVTDIRLGIGLNGWDVARFARQQRPRTAVVYMTGDSAADWASEGVPMGVLLQKPFAMAQMITAVSSLLISENGFR